ncbi:hypothetical protein JZ751_026161 [Albula glossodonta]|uniref:Uncharacterized protein n=1 Tax=Albula glossodonta TaxID=121402 RepID=A0A8T2PJW5_9TELE|nr:hypothetical protein JZ751_026161 [Albula glossodonta]
MYPVELRQPGHFSLLKGGTAQKAGEPRVPGPLSPPRWVIAQHDEALIFSETSKSDLATRKRSLPPPSRMRSTALGGETLPSEASNFCIISTDTIDLRVGSDEAGPIHGQDPVPDTEPPVGCCRPVGDQGPDVDPGSV